MALLAKKEIIMTNELLIITQTADLLNQIGKAKIDYITAELSPFSNQQRPDLVYYPSLIDKPVFVEYKLNASTLSPAFWNSFDEKKKFVEESSEVDIDYVFVTNDKLNDDIKSLLRNLNVNIFESIDDANSLFSEIKKNYYGK